jgi:Na+/melibiose symporter-like transporter
MGGSIIKKGRKQTFVYGNILSLLSCLVMLKMDVWYIIVGKFLHGYFVTLVWMAQGKMMSETVPVE